MNATTPERKVNAGVVREVVERMQNGEFIELNISLTAALVVLAALQREIRTGRFTEDSILLARSVAGLIEQQLATTPACAEHCERGWYRAFQWVAHARQK